MTETYINHGELLTQSLRDVKANFLAIMETNGWDLDYWATFTKGNLTYSVDGSHYYGNCKVEKVYDN